MKPTRVAASEPEVAAMRTVDETASACDAAGAAVTAVTDAELQALMRQARDRDDDALRRLVTGYLTMRRVGADVIAFLEARDGAASVARTPLLLHARQLTAR